MGLSRRECQLSSVGFLNGKKYVRLNSLAYSIENDQLLPKFTREYTYLIRSWDDAMHAYLVLAEIFP